MVKFVSLVTQKGECNTPAMIMRAINYVCRNLKYITIYIDNMLIANHTYEKHINAIHAAIIAAYDNKFRLNKNKCTFTPARI